MAAMVLHCRAKDVLATALIDHSRRLQALSVAAKMLRTDHGREENESIEEERSCNIETLRGEGEQLLLEALDVARQAGSEEDIARIEENIKVANSP